MAFKYACFISYCHGQYSLMTTFIQAFHEALKSSLEPYLDHQVYIDQERLRPGFRFNEALAHAICESVCMVVIYSPRYERHSYCLREYAAMRLLEKRRLQALGDRWSREKGLIIPVIFRGGVEGLPTELRSHIQYADFSKFTTATPRIERNLRYVNRIEDIARYISELYDAFEQSGIDFCADCHTFQLPQEEDVKPWRGVAPPTAAPFPGREASK